MKKLIILLFIAIHLINCNKITTEYFNGEILLTDISKLHSDTLSGEKIILQDIYAGYMTVYDTIMLFVSHSFPDYYLYIYNLNNGELIGKYAPKGQGPDDYHDFTHAEQFVVDNEGIKLWIRDGYGIENQLMNLTKTIRVNKAIIDSIIYLDWKKHTFTPFGYVFITDNGVLTRIQAERKTNHNYDPDRYEIYNIQQERLKKINIFNRPILKKKPDFPIENYYISRDRIKPDGSKIVMAMEMLAQINIYDIKKDKLKGFRIKDTPDFEYLTKDIQNYKIFFRDVCVDNDHIYALYSNVILEKNGKNYPFESNTILVYNWDGEIVKKIILDKMTSEITIDPLSSSLYILTNDDFVYKYNL